jgi:hypothetical protein
MSEDELKARFYKEVFMSSVEALLPKNLSDEWLEVLLSQAQCMHDKKNNAHFSLIVSAVLQILSNRSESAKITLTEDELLEYLNSYSMELSLEKINRVTDVRTSSATLETILTNRVIEMPT